MLPMIERHVESIIEEVAYGEGHTGVAGEGELGDEVILHLGRLGGIMTPQ